MKKSKMSIDKLKNTRLMYGVISIILSAIIAFVAIPMLNSKLSGKIEIVKITENISKGDVILESDLEIIEVGEYNLPTNIAKTKEDVIGKFAATDLVIGDYILSSNVSDFPITSDINLEYLPDGKMAMSFTVKTLASGLSGKLQSGDIIRLYYFNEEPITYEELSFLKVLSVTDSAGYNIDATREAEDDEEKQLSSTVTVMVSPEQALIISGMESDGDIHVSLVVRNNSTLADELLVRQDEIIAELYTEETDESNKDSIVGEDNSVKENDETLDGTKEISSDEAKSENIQTNEVENQEIGG